MDKIVNISYAHISPGVVIADSRGHPITGLIACRSEATLLVLDLEPGAAWPHSCFYILIPSGGPPLKMDHPWPPSDGLEVKPCR